MTTTDFLSKKERAEIRKELKLADEAERVALHSARKQAEDEARDLTARCAYCGISPTSSRAGTREIAKIWAGESVDGRITISRCGGCVSAERTYWDTENRLQMVLYAAMQRAGVEELWQDLDGREVAGLAWVGWAYRARLAGGDDPGDEKKAFDHLAGLTPETIDLTPM